MSDHPVLELLRSQIADAERFAATVQSELPGWTGTTIERYVSEHGRPFTGVKRPRAYRRRSAKQCFVNAAMLAMESRGTYVEGYATQGVSILIRHAWVTVDDIHAIDVTWTNPERALYLGVPIPSTVLAKFVCPWNDLLSPLQRIVFGK